MRPRARGLAHRFGVFGARLDGVARGPFGLEHSLDRLVHGGVAAASTGVVIVFGLSVTCLDAGSNGSLRPLYRRRPEQAACGRAIVPGLERTERLPLIRPGQSPPGNTGILALGMGRIRIARLRFPAVECAGAGGPDRISIRTSPPRAVGVQNRSELIMRTEVPWSSSATERLTLRRLERNDLEPLVRALSGPRNPPVFSGEDADTRANARRAGVVSRRASGEILALASGPRSKVDRIVSWPLRTAPTGRSTEPRKSNSRFSSTSAVGVRASPRRLQTGSSNTRGIDWDRSSIRPSCRATRRRCA